MTGLETIQIDVRLNSEEVKRLLEYFDDSSDIPLHLGLDIASYSEKLSKNAHFIIVWHNKKMVAFLAYYLNDDGRFVYVPQVIVHKEGRHRGLGHKMFEALGNNYSDKYDIIQLEVLKENSNARRFYEREKFIEKEDRKERLLLCKNIKQEKYKIN